MYSNNRDAYRESFYQTWQKHNKQQHLSQLEKQLLAVILDHPEYHRLLNNTNLTHAYALEENPFLHMGLHLAVREQIALDRPMGIKSVYQELLSKCNAAHEVEHYMMTCLAKILWTAQREETPADDEEYLRQLRDLL